MQRDETHWQFSADVYDTLEMLPWLRTFTDRITDLQCTDRRVTERFRNDLEEMAQTNYYAKLLGVFEPMPEEAVAKMQALIAADQAV